MSALEDVVDITPELEPALTVVGKVDAVLGEEVSFEVFVGPCINSVEIVPPHF